MRHRFFRFGCALGAAALLSLSAATADAHHGPAHVHSVQPVSVTAQLASPPAPYGPYVNHAHAAPPFQWGWFGAEHFYPRVQWGRDYNGDVLRWSKQRRY